MTKAILSILSFLILFSSIAFSSDHCLTRPTEGADTTCPSEISAAWWLLGFLAIFLVGFVIYMTRKPRNASLNAEISRIEQLRKSGQLTDSQAREEKDRVKSKFVRSQTSKSNQ